MTFTTSGQEKELLAPILAIFFPGPLAFCKKAADTVSSKKNMLNSSVKLSCKPVKLCTY